MRTVSTISTHITILGNCYLIVVVSGSFPIVLGAANRRALRGETVPSENFGSICSKSQGGSIGDSEAIFDGNLVDSAETNGGFYWACASVRRAVGGFPL